LFRENGEINSRKGVRLVKGEKEHMASFGVKDSDCYTALEVFQTNGASIPELYKSFGYAWKHLFLSGLYRSYNAHQMIVNLALLNDVLQDQDVSNFLEALFQEN
jgi:hypothetical protein